MFLSRTVIVCVYVSKNSHFVEFIKNGQIVLLMFTPSVQETVSEKSYTIAAKK